MSVARYVKALESDNSRLAKEGVIKRATNLANNGDKSAQIFLSCARLCYDPYSKWGVAQIPESSNTGDTGCTAWDLFFALLDNLKHRRLTGHAARDAIVETMTHFNQTDWNLVCRRVLIKDLRAGITATTLNKFVNEDYQVPGFGVQLATDSKGQPENMTGRRRLEYKFDGVRMVAIVQDGEVTLTSRNGKDLENFPQIAESIKTLIPHLESKFPNGFVLDGEVMGQSFQDLMKHARRKKDAVTDNMVYHIFDIVDLSAFKEGKWNKSQADRTSYVLDLKQHIADINNLTVSEGRTVDCDTPEGLDALFTFFSQAVAEGYEGIMIKDLDAPYDCKRTKSWLKMKPNLTLDLTVVAVERGTGRNAGCLGALVCEGEDEGRLIRVNVGSGLSDAQREEFWDNQDAIIGSVAEVMADAVTQNQDGSYSMRFPRFVRFRGFEAGEKI